jgi:hypothetical protein
MELASLQIYHKPQRSVPNLLLPLRLQMDWMPPVWIEIPGGFHPIQRLEPSYYQWEETLVAESQRHSAQFVPIVKNSCY